MTEGYFILLFSGDTFQQTTIITSKVACSVHVINKQHSFTSCSHTILFKQVYILSFEEYKLLKDREEKS